LLTSELINGGGSLLGRVTLPGEKVLLIAVDREWVVSAMVCVWWFPLLNDADEAGVDEFGG
jgi:hypothetical protein